MRTTQANSGPTEVEAEPDAREDGRRHPLALTRVSTVAALVDALRQRILDGEFAPRTALREVELASEYGVARHSVRAALQSLAQTGLLSHFPNRGVYVPEMTAADIADLFRLRTALEVEAVTMLAEIGQVTLEVDAALARLAHLPPDTRWSTVIETDLDFHRALVQSTGSPRLDSVYAGLQQEVQLCLTPLRGRWQPSETITRQHSVILDFIRQRDPQTAAAEVRAHVDASCRQLLELSATAADPDLGPDMGTAPGVRRAADPVPDRR